MSSSLRTTLSGLWILILIVSAALAFLMVEGYQQGVGHQISQTESQLAKAVDEISHRFAIYLSSFSGKLPSPSDERNRSEWRTLLTLVLSDREGIEGGFWTPSEGFVAYAFPTYQGDLSKKDLPHAEMDRIATIARETLTKGSRQNRRFDGKRLSLFLEADPVQLGDHQIVAWTMTWSTIAASGAQRALVWGLVILLLFVLGSGALMLTVLSRFSGRIRHLEESIVGVPVDELPPLHSTGHRELDRLVNAINLLNQRLASSRVESASLAQKLSRADRLATLGKMAAGIAHEIRNPLATIRLRAENSLDEPEEARRLSVNVVIEQISRLDTLLDRLLAFTKFNANPQTKVSVKPWLEKRVETISAQAAAAQVSLCVEAKDGEVWMDERSTAGALENLLLNAVQHSPAGTQVTLSSILRDAHWILAVEDSGGGVAPEDRQRIFEPFTSGRPDGIGLGLSLVKEAAEAQGGTVQCVAGRVGARFELILPCPKS